MPQREPRPVAPVSSTGAMPTVATDMGRGGSAARPRKLPDGRRGYDHLQGLLQITDEIRFVLDADREAEQGVLDLGLGAGDAGVRHLTGVLDQRLDASEADGKLKNPRAARYLRRRLEIAPHGEGDHAGEIAHLPGRDAMTGMVGEPRVEHLTHGRMFAQELGDGEPIAAVTLHPHRQRLNATQYEPAVERPRHRA